MNVDFFRGKNKRWKGGLSDLLNSPKARQGHHLQGSRPSLAPKLYFSKSALNAQVPGQDHVRVTHITEGNIELQLISVTLAY